MFGLYTIIILLFCLACLSVAIWSWRKIVAVKGQLQWPETQADVVASELDRHRLPHVEYRYAVDGQAFSKTLVFSEDRVSSPGGAKSCLDDFPLGASFKIYYQPSDPQTVVLNRGPNREDQLIFYIGLFGFLFGLLLLVLTA